MTLQIPRDFEGIKILQVELSWGFKANNSGWLDLKWNGSCIWKYLYVDEM